MQALDSLFTALTVLTGVDALTALTSLDGQVCQRVKGACEGARP